MSEFETFKNRVIKGEQKVPSVTIGDARVSYLKYQLATHKFNLGLMSKGLKFRGITFTQIKGYYGLKSRSAKDAYPEFLKLIEAFDKEMVTLN